MALFRGLYHAIALVLGHVLCDELGVSRTDEGSGDGINLPGKGQVHFVEKKSDSPVSRLETGDRS